MIAVGTFCAEIWSKSRIQLNSIHLSKSLVHLIQSTEWALFGSFRSLTCFWESIPSEDVYVSSVPMGRV